MPPQQEPPPCFPLLDFFQKLGRSDDGNKHHSSVFVYDKSWDGEDEEDTYPEWISSSGSSSSSSSFHGQQQQQHHPNGMIMGENAKTRHPQFGRDSSTSSEEDEYGSELFGEDNDQRRRRPRRHSTSPIHKDRVIFTTVKSSSDNIGRSQSLDCLASVTTAATEEEDGPLELKRIKSAPAITMPSKRFRWAEVNQKDDDDDDVQVQVHEVESWKDRTDLWWNDSEYLNIKNGVLATTQFCKSKNRSHIELLEELIKRTSSTSSDVDHQDEGNDGDNEEDEEEAYQNNLLKDLSSSDTCSRGLEGHMSQLINRYRKIHSRRVLNAQVACRYQNNCYNNNKNDNNEDRKDAYWNALREQSMEKSKPLSSFARKMGQFDEMQARHQTC
eukprot:scaffold4501_cov118-Cylindrotheca_fusiformis.AAC.3